jgi:hypothetical protein
MGLFILRNSGNGSLAAENLEFRLAADYQLPLCR